MAFVLAVAGKIGSGKTTISSELARVLGCKRASFGDYVRHVVSQRGLETTRENLQRIGTEILTADAFQFCKEVLAFSGWTKGESLVIDGLRHRETISHLNQLINPAHLRIVYLDLDEETRLGRLRMSKRADAAALASVDSHSSEQQLAALRDMADLAINCRRPIADCVAQVVEWMEKV